MPLRRILRLAPWGVRARILGTVQRQVLPRVAAALGVVEGVGAAVDREPESFSAWAGLASVLARSDPAGSASAAARAKRLNRYYRPPS